MEVGILNRSSCGTLDLDLLHRPEAGGSHAYGDRPDLSEGHVDLVPAPPLSYAVHRLLQRIGNGPLFSARV
jgi:hypothetical protein